MFQDVGSAAERRRRGRRARQAAPDARPELGAGGRRGRRGAPRCPEGPGHGVSHDVRRERLPAHAGALLRQCGREQRQRGVADAGPHVHHHLAVHFQFHLDPDEQRRPTGLCALLCW